MILDMMLSSASISSTAGWEVVITSGNLGIVAYEIASTEVQILGRHLIGHSSGK